MNLAVCAFFSVFCLFNAWESFVARRRSQAYMRDALQCLDVAQRNAEKLKKSLEEDYDAVSGDLVLAANACLPTDVLSAQSSAEHRRADTMSLNSTLLAIAAVASYFFIP